MDMSCMAHIKQPPLNPAKAAPGLRHVQPSRGAGLMVPVAAPIAQEATEQHLLLSEGTSAAEDGGDSGGMIGAWRPPELQQSYAALHGNPLSRRGSVSNAGGSSTWWPQFTALRYDSRLHRPMCVLL